MPKKYQTGGFIPPGEYKTIGFHSPIPNDWTVVGKTGVGFKADFEANPSFGIKDIQVVHEFSHNHIQFAVRTINLDTGVIETWPTIIMTDESLMSYGDDSEVAHYVATKLANYMNRPDLVSSLNEYLMKHVVNKWPFQKTFSGGGYIAPAILSSDTFVSYSKMDSPEALSRKLPGIYSKVKHPITHITCTIHYIIQSLNDHYGWTREQIADWLDEISDPTGETGPDLRFKPKDDTLEQLEIDEEQSKIEAGLIKLATEVSINFQIDEEATKKLLDEINNYKEEPNEQD